MYLYRNGSDLLVAPVFFLIGETMGLVQITKHFNGKFDIKTSDLLDVLDVKKTVL